MSGKIGEREVFGGIEGEEVEEEVRGGERATGLKLKVVLVSTKGVVGDVEGLFLIGEVGEILVGVKLTGNVGSGGGT